jgi:hypothetical protein
VERAEADNRTDFLIADLEQFGEALWRNEERGEKRMNFFLTLVTAVIAGLVVLHTEGKGPLNDCTLRYIRNGAFVGLIVFGLMTYLRMLHRNRVTDQYKSTLDHIRDMLLAINPPLEGYRVPQPLSAGKWKRFRGGLAETVGALNAVLLCALLIINSVSVVLAVAIGLFVLIILWKLAAYRKGIS